MSMKDGHNLFVNSVMYIYRNGHGPCIMWKSFTMIIDFFHSGSLELGREMTEQKLSKRREVSRVPGVQKQRGLES